MYRPMLSLNRRGTALPMVIVVLVILGVISVAALRTTDDARHAAHGVRENTRAFYAAEAGIEALAASWASQQYDTLLAAPGDSLDLGWQTIPQNGANYHAVIHRVDDGTEQVFSVVVEGRSASGRGGSQDLAVQIAKFPLFPQGVIGRNSVSTSGNGHIFGSVGTNGNVTLSGSSQIFGDASAGGTVNNPGNVTGTVTQGAPPISIPDVACPAGPYGPAPTGSGVNFNSGNGNIGLTGSGNKTFVTGTYYYHDVIKDGDGELVVPVGNVVEIYIDGMIHFDGGGFNNAGGDPGNLRLYGCDNNTSNWVMNGNSSSWLSIYAPSVVLDLEGNGDRHGQFIAGEISRANDGSIYYDARGAFTGGFTPVGGSWVQLSF